MKGKIEQLNASRMADKRKRFMVKVWVTKTKEVSEGVKQSYLHWNHERLNYERLLKLYCKQMKDMAEHTFMATWNYCQYKKAKQNLVEGQVLIVDGFTQIICVATRMSLKDCIGCTSKLQFTPV